MSSGSSSESNKSDQRVWGPQGRTLEGIYPQLEGLSDYIGNNVYDQVGQNQVWNQGVQDQAQGAFANQLSGGVYQGLNSGQGFGQSLQDSMDNPTYSQDALQNIGTNNYSDAHKQQFKDDASEAMGLAFANSDARASAAGMGGSSRHGMLQAQQSEDITDQLQASLANVGYQDHNQNAQRQLSVAGQADQNRFGQQQMMQQLLNSGQNTANQVLPQFAALQNMGMGNLSALMAPGQAYGGLMDAIGAPTVLTKSRGSGGSSNWGIL